MCEEVGYPHAGDMAMPSSYGSDPGPWVVAHRGGAGLGLENRLETFARSAALGVRYFETDVRVSADGVAMAFHDDVLDRVTYLRGPVPARKAAELTRAGVPTLVELLDALGNGLGDGRLAVDVKSGSAVRPLVDAVRRTGSAHRVCVAGGWDGWLARRVVAAAAGLGVRVLAWTIDEPERMRRLLDDGVTGLITDRPDLAREVLVARDQWRGGEPAGVERAGAEMISAAASR